MKRRFGAGLSAPTFSLHERRRGEGNGLDSHSKQSASGRNASMGKFD